MTEEVKPNFLKSIKFEEEFLPFEKDTKIEFGGEKEVQRMIEFYLKNKGIEDYKENAERFKINCVLGDNGGGKSRLFESLKKNKVLANKGLFDLCEVQTFINKHVHKNKDNPHTNLVINNFFGTYNFNNKFILNIFNFLIRNNLDEIFSIFLNLKNIKEKYVTINIKEIIETEIFYSNFENQEEEDVKLLIKLFHQINSSQIFNNNIIEAIYLAYSDIIIELFIKSHEKRYREKETGIIMMDFIDIVNNNKYKNSITNENPNIDYDKLIQDSNRIKTNIKENNPMGRLYFQSFKTLGIIGMDLLDKYNKNPIKIYHTINKDDFTLLSNFIFDLNVIFSDGIYQKQFNHLSSGEKITLSRFSKIYQEIISQLGKKIEHFTVLIDEPDLHLHLDWQRQYIQKLIDVFSTLDPNIKLHFIIATHSPFIISDLPKESLVLLNKGEQVPNKEIPETFGANYIDIIKNGFFFKKEQMLMGSFAQNIIGNIAENERKQFCSDEGKTFSNLIENNIGDEFLKDNLLYFKPEKND